MVLEKLFRKELLCAGCKLIAPRPAAETSESVAAAAVFGAKSAGFFAATARSAAT